MATYLSYQGVNYVPWKYYGDFSSNLMIYLAKRPVPQDVNLVHATRSRIFTTRTRISLLLNLMEFIEDFGANTNVLMVDLDEVNDMITSSMEVYIDLRFEDVLEAYKSIDDVLEVIEEEAMDLKDRALLWVFIIEWLAVTATGLIAGVVLWSVMVRRRLYREVGATRLLSSD
jgi:hypothetical protein